jgi:type I restriction enzyme S subunit
VISAAIGGKSLAGTVCSTPWDWHEIHDLAAKDSNSITDGLFGSKLKTEHYTVSGPRVIRLQNVGDGVFVDEKAHISPDHFASLSKHRVYPGDLVIAALGETLPRACLVPDTLGPAIAKADCIRFKPGGKVLSKYLMYALNAAQTRRATKARLHGVGRLRLNLGEIKSIVVPVPPLSTQEVIVAEVERRLSTADEGEAQIDANLRRPEALRQAILKRAFEAGSGSDQGTN